MLDVTHFLWWIRLGFSLSGKAQGHLDTQWYSFGNGWDGACLSIKIERIHETTKLECFLLT